MTGTVQTQERGGAGKAQPPLNCLTHLNAALHCKDQAAQFEQEQWSAEGVQPPLNCSHYIRYNFNAGCSAGSAPFFVIRRITPYLFCKHLCAPFMMLQTENIKWYVFALFALAFFLARIVMAPVSIVWPALTQSTKVRLTFFVREENS